MFCYRLYRAEYRLIADTSFHVGSHKDRWNLGVVWKRKVTFHFNLNGRRGLIRSAADERLDRPLDPLLSFPTNADRRGGGLAVTRS